MYCLFIAVCQYKTNLIYDKYNMFLFMCYQISMLKTCNKMYRQLLTKIKSMQV